MASTSPPPDFGPVPSPFASGRPSESARDYIFYLRHSDRYTSHPTSWGFTLYRAVFGPGTDERFAEALRRLRVWVQWHTKQSRYSGFTYEEKRDNSPFLPTEGAPHDTDELARRFWIEVVEDYPGRDAVRSGPDVEPGSEDFSPVGRAFLEWVREHDKNIDQLEEGDFKDEPWSLYVRHDHCLIVDEAALSALETLPEHPPEVELLPRQEERSRFETHRHAWLWLLDRKTMRFQELGRPPVRCRWMEPDHPPFPPWCRIDPALLYLLWFGRPQRYSPWNWSSVVLDGRDEEFGKVRRWVDGSTSLNELRASRSKAAREAEQGHQTGDEGKA